jgi:hypothetical protein
MTQDSPDIEAAVAALHPRLTRLSLLALLAMAVVLAIGTWLLVYFLGRIDDGVDRFKAAAIIAGLGIALMVLAYGQMRKAQEALVMPLVAKAVGLTYQKDAKGFFRALPPALLPKTAVRTGEDYVIARLGPHEIRLAEVKVETGGKNSRTLFEGIVAEFHNRVPMPAFLLAPHEQTRPGVLFGSWIPTDGLVHRRDIAGPSGTEYGLWTGHSASPADAPALDKVVTAILGLERRIAAPVELFTATSNGSETCIALTHERNLFRIGGLFPQRAQVLADVQIAATDLSIALSLAHELIAIEALVTEAASTP